MKKNLGNIFTLAALMMAGAAFTACSSSDEIILDQPAAPGEQVYTLTISAVKDGGSTRALALDGTKLVASWADGDELTVYNVTKGAALTGSLTASDADGSKASFSGTLTGTIEKDDVLTLSYHQPAGFSTYAAQTGTLASAAACDYAAANVTVASVNSGEIEISETAASFATQTAALKLTLTDGTNKLNATQLKVEATMSVPSVGSMTVELATFNLSSNTYSANGDGVLYLVLPNKATAAAYVANRINKTYGQSISAEKVENNFLPSATITFTATVGADSYTVGKTGYTFEAAKYYATTLTMAAPAPVSLIVNPEVGQVIGADGKNYADAAAATSAGATAVAMIVYVGSDNGEAAPYNHGLALALSDANDGSSCKWKTSNTDAGHTKQTDSDNFASESGLQYNAMHNSEIDNYPAFKAAITYSPAAPTGCSAWFLASGYQWQKMIGAAGLSNLGLQSGSYWSSTESASFDAWFYYFDSGDWSSVSKENDFVRGRACLAF